MKVDGRRYYLLTVSLLQCNGIFIPEGGRGWKKPDAVGSLHPAHTPHPGAHGHGCWLLAFDASQTSFQPQHGRGPPNRSQSWGQGNTAEGSGLDFVFLIFV